MTNGRTRAVTEGSRFTLFLQQLDNLHSALRYIQEAEVFSSHVLKGPDFPDRCQWDYTDTSIDCARPTHTTEKRKQTLSKKTENCQRNLLL